MKLGTVEPNIAMEDVSLIQKMEQLVLQSDIDGMPYEHVKDAMNITMVLTKHLVSKSLKVVDVNGRLIHEEAFIDLNDGADCLEIIIDKLMQKNNGYISSTQLFEYACSEMNMFLNDNNVQEVRAIYDIARYLFEKVHYHGKQYSFYGNTHISRFEDGITSNLDIIKKYAADQGGVFSFEGLVEYLQSLCIGTRNLRNQMKLPFEPIFLYCDYGTLICSEIMNIDDVWKKLVANALKALFADVGDHVVLRDISPIWFDQLPAIPGGQKWTPLLLQSVLRFYSEELGARTIPAMDGQALETLHTMLIENNSPILDFGDVIISYLTEHDIKNRTYEAEDLRLLLVKGGILRGNELIWNMSKALKRDHRFAWDITGNQVTIKI